MKKIRHSVFETNSSSTHSICIAKNTKYNLPTKIHFEFDDFGWEFSTLNSIEKRASYLYTGIQHVNGLSENKFLLKNILKHLLNENIVVTLEYINKNEPINLKKLKTVDHDYDINIKNLSYRETGYIDHGDELYEFYEKLSSSKELLFDFLFSPFSVIFTGNDNKNIPLGEPNPKSEYEKFYKGN